jgi:hypothetical protein
MQEQEKILVIHDTLYPEINDSFKSWLVEFQNNLRSAVKRTTGNPKEFVLSLDLMEYAEQIPDLRPEEFDYYLILIHDEVSRTDNLKRQFDQLLNYLRSLPRHLQTKKTTLIFLKESPLDHEILQIHIEKVIKFYSQKGFNLYQQTELMSSSDKDYWVRILDIIDLISHQAELKSKRRSVKKQPIIAYIGRTTPDLEGQREILMNELNKVGIETLPDSNDIKWSDITEEVLIDLLDVSELIIQLIGGKSGMALDDSGKPGLEIEYDLITKFMNGEISRNIGKPKTRSRIIWLPESIEIQDIFQEKLIEKIRKQISYSGWDTELITGSFEQLKEFVMNILKSSIAHKVSLAEHTLQNSIYLVHEKSVYQDALDVASQLRNYPIDVVLTHDLHLQERFIRAHHETLQNCDAVLVHYGLNNAQWYESTLKEIIKISKTQRKRPFAFQAVISDKEPVLHLPKFDEFLYLKVSELMGQDFFKKYLKKMIG